MNSNPPSPISCLIIDDEPLSHQLLTEFIERTPALTLVGKARNAPEGLRMCQDMKPALILLDVQMPLMNGIELLAALPGPHPLVIITSAYKDYAVKGFDYGVVDYLEKPIFFPRFTQAVQRAEAQLVLRRSKKEAVSADEQHKRDHLSVRVGTRQVFIPLSTINYVEACQNYVKIQQRDRPVAVMTKIPLAEIEKRLAANSFTRIHRKYIICLDQVYQSTSSSIQLFSGEELPIGVSYQDSVRKALARS